MKNLKHLILAAAMSCAWTGAATAADSEHSVRVSYADLNTASQAGSQTLLLRIRAASRQVCAPKPDSRDLAGVHLYGDCMKDSVRKAVAALDLPQLNLAYENSEDTYMRGASVAAITRDEAPAR